MSFREKTDFWVTWQIKVLSSDYATWTLGSIQLHTCLWLLFLEMLSLFGLSLEVDLSVLVGLQFCHRCLIIFRHLPEQCKGESIHISFHIFICVGLSHKMSAVVVACMKLNTFTALLFSVHRSVSEILEALHLLGRFTLFQIKCESSTTWGR